MKNQKLLLLVLIFAILISSCNAAGPKAVEDTTGTASPNPAEELLSYTPAEWIDQHPAEANGPMLYFLDFEAMSRDLDLPDVSGADDRQTKLPLITGIANQGLPFTPDRIDPMAGSSFSDWGWDIADVSQALFCPDKSISILRGLFSVEYVTEVLGGKGYLSVQSGKFILFTEPTETQAFAVSQDMILIAPSRDELERMFQPRSSTEDKAGDLPQIRQLISLSDSPHGFILIPSGDLTAMQERLGFSPFWDQRSYIYDWDFAIIAFRSAEGSTRMDIGYWFPTDQDAAANLSIVREVLTESPSLRFPSVTWADLMTLESVTDQGNLVAAQATTAGETFLGTSINSRDYYGFLPARPVEPDSLLQAQAVLPFLNRFRCTMKKVELT